MTARVRLHAATLLVAASLCATVQAQSVMVPRPVKRDFQSHGRLVAYDEWDAKAQPAHGTVIVLHGASGPRAEGYRRQAAFFAGQGYRSLLLHYFDASGSRTPTDANYAAWSGALEDLLNKVRSENPETKVYVTGYSLGASVALAAGSQGAKADAIAEWFGSLPDAFFERLKGMPPLLILHGRRDTNVPVVNAEQLIRLCGMAHFTCESHIYPDEGHGFAGQALEDAEGRTLAFFAAH